MSTEFSDFLRDLYAKRAASGGGKTAGWIVMTHYDFGDRTVTEPYGWSIIWETQEEAEKAAREALAASGPSKFGRARYQVHAIFTPVFKTDWDGPFGE